MLLGRAERESLKLVKVGEEEEDFFYFYNHSLFTKTENYEAFYKQKYEKVVSIEDEKANNHKYKHKSVL